MAKGRGPGRGKRLLLGCLGLLILAGLGWYQLRPAVESMVAYQARVFAVRLINSAILAELDRAGADYGALVQITRSAGGNVTSIQADMAAINRLKAQVSDAVVRELEEMGTASLQVRLGTLVGNELTAGRGPPVEIRVHPVGYVETNLTSRFGAAGINQTHHQISLSVSVEMEGILPGYRVRCQTTADYLIAETVIVGEIPDTYLGLDAGSPFLQKLPEG